jgi:hypothetical protein
MDLSQLVPYVLTQLSQIVPYIIAHLSQIVPYVLAHAQWVGPALLAAGIAIRLLGRAIGRALLLAGLLATAVLAYQEWNAVHSLALAGGILFGGIAVFGLLAWTIRGLSFLFSFVLLASAFFLVVYGWIGPSFAVSTTGSLTWAGATILTMIVTGFSRGRAVRLLTPGLGAALVH